MSFSFTSLFGGGAGAGGIEHSGGGKTTPLPVNNPQQQLSTGTQQPQQKTAEQLAAEQHAADPLNAHLADLSSVWNTAKTADGKPIAPQADPLSQPLFSFKQEDVLASAKKLDFTSQVNPELFTQVAAGGDAAVAAMKEIMNGVAQTVFAAQTLNMGQVMNDGFARHGKAFDAALPTRLRNHEVANRVSDDPVLSHPAVAPIITAMKATIAAQQPGMRPDQIQAAAENYVKGLGTAMNLQETKTVAKKEVEGQVDWMQWANLDQGK